MMKRNSSSENQHIEWKASWRDEYIKWICGFANAQGGTLVIGKDDKGKITGIRDAKKLLEDIPNKVRDFLGIIVDVNLRVSRKKEYIEIVVEPYPYPISHKGRYYFRSGSTRQELKGAALDKFLLQKQGKRWDGVPVPHVQVDDFSNEAFNRFKTLAKKSGRMSEAVLHDSNDAITDNLQLKETDFIKRAAILLFHHDPEKYVTGAFIKIGFFRTDADLLYQDEVHGHLFDQADKTLDLLLTKYLRAYIDYEGITRVERYPFPKDALREALLNAIVHKDYSSGVPIQISVYEDKIYFWNDGQLPEDWTIEHLLNKHPSKPYNPLIANAFFRAGSIESWGRGIEKIQAECKEAGVPAPTFNYDMPGLMIEFKAKDVKSSPKSSGKTRVETLVETRVETKLKTPDLILDTLNTNPNMTLADVAKQIGRALSTIERASSKLVREGKLRHVGAKKGGYWEVTKKK